MGLDPGTPGSCPEPKADAQPLSHPGIWASSPISCPSLLDPLRLMACPLGLFIYLFKDFIYLFMRDTQKEAETQAEGEAGSMQGARCGT